MPMVCLIFLSEKKEAVLSVIPGCAHWHCQELRGGWEYRREEKSYKNTLFIPGNIEEKPFHATGVWHDLTVVSVTTSKAFCPLLPSLQGETSKSLPCESPKRGNVDLDLLQLRLHGTIGLQENGCHR